MEAQTSILTKRILFLYDKQIQLTVKICKNHETISSIILGDNEFATRTWLNLKNLKVIRGNIENGKLIIETSMTGPHEYFGWVCPFDTFIIRDNIFYKVNQSIINQEKETLPKHYVLKVRDFNWQSHCLKTSKNSLFTSPGLLYINDINQMNFNIIENPQDYDLSSFKVQVVNNEAPFSFKNIRDIKDAQYKLRVITYFYGHKYASHYLSTTDGHFIEQHLFTYLMISETKL